MSIHEDENKLIFESYLSNNNSEIDGKIIATIAYEYGLSNTGSDGMPKTVFTTTKL